MRKLLVGVVATGAALLPMSVVYAASATAKPPPHCGGLGQKACPPPEAPCAVGLILGSTDICIIP